MYRTGIGYDIHRFVDGRKLILGGVEIEYSRGLDGHSDADVLLHAVCDAVLGAIGKGDIGEHFPNTDDAFKDISSEHLLSRVVEMAQAQGFSVVNLDSVLQAQEPNIKKYKKEMIRRIASLLEVTEDVVNVKATTQEGLGSLGNKEGIAAFATVLLQKKE